MEHYYKSVPGWFFHEALFSVLIKQAPENSTIIEVGSWKGKSASFIGVEAINADKGIELVCIDTFEGSDEEEHHKDADVIAGTLFERFTENTEPVSDILTVYQESSPFAATFFHDETAHIVYLDAAHTYEAVKEDIKAWWPKVAPGGWLIGDDWMWDGVRKAVEEAFPEDQIEIATTGYPAWCVRKIAALLD